MDTVQDFIILEDALSSTTLYITAHKSGPLEGFVLSIRNTDGTMGDTFVIRREELMEKLEGAFA